MSTMVKSALVGAAAAAALLVGTPGYAATPTFTKSVAYVRDGAIFVSKGATEKRLTPDTGNARPRWDRAGRTLAYLHDGELWQMNADGSARHRVTAGVAAGAAFSPDGQWIAYSAPACLGGPGVYRVRATQPHGAPEVLFPAECRTQPVPAATAVEPGPKAGTLADKLRTDDAVAWSPDGTRIAFTDGDCAGIYDDCLSVGNIATGGERTVDAYGGGGSADGFAVVPTFNGDGTRVAWTAFRDGAVRVIEEAADGTGRRVVGVAGDRELAYHGTDKALVTGQYKGRSWVILLDLKTGKRTPFHQGSQATIQP